MGMTSTGFVELRDEVDKMAETMQDLEGGKATLRWIMQASAQPILSQMIRNYNADLKTDTGALKNAIKIGKVVKHRKGGWTVTVGVHKGDGGADYANPVEYGHGGPHPAPAHPFIRPAFDQAAGEAYEQIKNNLAAALNARGK